MQLQVFKMKVLLILIWNNLKLRKAQPIELLMNPKAEAQGTKHFRLNPIA